MGLVTLLLSSPPASAGPPFITDDPEPTDYQHWELYLFSQGTHETGETSGVCDCNYGFLPNVQLHIHRARPSPKQTAHRYMWGRAIRN
jgi:hypothetical protein